MLTDLGWREVLMAICVLLAIYAAFILFQLYELKQGKKPVAFSDIFDRSGGSGIFGASGSSDFSDPLAFSPRPAVAAYTALSESGPDTDEKREPSAKNGAAGKNGQGERDERKDAIFRDILLEDFTSKVEKRLPAVEREVDQLRKEVGRLRAEILLLREACQKKLAEDAENANKPPLPPPISSFYGDAMQMASQGENMESISQLCSISQAEAELVVALVKNRAA